MAIDLNLLRDVRVWFSSVQLRQAHLRALDKNVKVIVILLAENGYPPVDRDEVYKEIFEQAENFKKYQASGARGF